MTEQEWLTSEDPYAMFRYLTKEPRWKRHGGPEERKLNLLVRATSFVSRRPEPKEIWTPFADLAVILSDRGVRDPLPLHRHPPRDNRQPVAQRS